MGSDCMNFINHTLLYGKNNFMQLRRKWIPLPLLLLFPVIIIGLIFVIILAIFSPDSAHDPIRVGVVDSDQSKEAQLIQELIDETSQLGSFIELQSMTLSEAKKGINTNQLSTYIELPKKFTANLYNGTPVTLPITGNPNRAIESHLIKELVDSVARHIRTSQANILTINYFAKALSIDDKTRNDLLFEHFKEFLLYTIGKDKVLDQEEITNLTTTSPVNYFGIASWFIIVTLWLFGIYNFLYREETQRLKKRMRLYGVTELQQIIARIITTLLVTTVFALISLIVLNMVLTLELQQEDHLRIGIIMLLYGLLILVFLAILEITFSSQKIRLLGQSIGIGILLTLSGSFIPILYFPLKLQAIMPYIFSSEAFHWLQEIILNGRFYADYIPLLFMCSAGFCILIGLSLGKERVQQ
jgi:ABC-2 type transport system permease protein